MAAPLVTIVTPTYNKPRLFAECAEAVLAQRFTDWVWWVVFNVSEVRQMNPYFGKWIDDCRAVPIIYPVDEKVRVTCHVPARIVNWLYPKIQTPYIYFLADDDLIDPDGLGALVNAAAGENWDGSWIPRHGLNPPRGFGKAIDAVYGRCDVQSEQPDGSFKHVGWLHPGEDFPFVPGAQDIGFGTGIQPDCLIDGGQVLHTKALWDRATVCSYCNGAGRIIHSPEMSSSCDTCNETGRSWQLPDSPAEEHASHNDGTLLNRLAQFARFHYVPQRIVTHRRTSQSRWHKPTPNKEGL